MKKSSFDGLESIIRDVDIMNMDINDYIRTLAILKDAASDIKTMKIRLGIEKKIDSHIAVFEYLRDKFGIRKYSDVLRPIIRKEVDPLVIGIWIDEEMYPSKMFFAAILAGYPEYREKLDQKLREYSIKYDITILLDEINKRYL